MDTNVWFVPQKGIIDFEEMPFGQRIYFHELCWVDNDIKAKYFENKNKKSEHRWSINDEEILVKTIKNKYPILKTNQFFIVPGSEYITKRIPHYIR